MTPREVVVGRIGLGIVVLLASFGQALAGPAELRARKAMQADLRKIVAQPAARVGLFAVVVKRMGGPVLFARRSKARLHPASCTKILTSAAAFRRLGPDFRFDTVLLGRQKGAEIQGPLVLWGQGDPSLTHEDLDNFADVLQKRGVRHVPLLLVDDSFFSRRRFPPGYGKPDDSGYAAPTGAVSVDGNRVLVTVRDASEGQGPCRAEVAVEPSCDYVEVKSSVRCGDKTKVEVDALRGRAKTVVRVYGTVAPGAGPRTFSRRIFHPDLFAASVFRRALSRRGIRVDKMRRGVRPAGLPELLRHKSAPLATLIEHMNFESDNFYAEQILRALGAKVFGRPGTTQKGLKVVAAMLGRAGVRRGRYRLTNGSGLFGHTRLAPIHIVRFLEHVFTLPWLGRLLADSLPTACRTGTLAGRMGGGPACGRVRAKTGTLRGVSCLAGYVLDRGGRPRVVFAIMHNRIRGSVRPSRRIQDRIVNRVVQYLNESLGR